MKKALLLFLLLILAACGSNSTSETAVIEPTATDTAEVAPAETTNETPATAVADTNELTPATTPEEASQIREQDHIVGATDPAVTIIEYGDFQ
ncbi:MAG: hypothetical protein ACE5EY_15625 [Anaerolineae bacterium]